jgi:hypothetical protein
MEQLDRYIVLIVTLGSSPGAGELNVLQGSLARSFLDDCVALVRWPTW